MTQAQDPTQDRSVEDIASRIRTYVASELLFEDRSVADALADDTPLLTLLDSLGLTQLVAFVEQEFEVEIDDAEVTADNFRTVGDLARLVGSKSP